MSDKIFMKNGISVSKDELRDDDGRLAFLPNTDIYMSGVFAYVDRGFGLVVVNDEKIGYRCSLEACHNLSKSKGGNDVYSVKIDDEIFWTSDIEFKREKLTEYTIPKSEFLGVK